MGLRFRRSIRLGKGVRLNLSKSGVGFSMGAPGYRVGIGPRGLYTSVGLPGTGLFWLQHTGWGTGRLSSNRLDGVNQMRLLLPRAQAGLRSDLSWLLYGLAVVILLSSLNAAGTAVALILALLGYTHQQSGPVRLGRLYGAAEAQAAQGCYQKATEFLRQVQGELPSEAVCQALARCHLLQDDVTGAVAEFGHYESLGGQLSPASVLTYSAALGMCGHADKGLERVESLPGSPAGDTCRIAITGDLLLKVGRTEQAIEVLKQAPLRQRKPDTTLTHVRLRLADAYAQSGQRAKALAMYRRVYADNPSLEGVSDLIAQLESQLTTRRSRDGPRAT